MRSQLKAAWDWLPVIVRAIVLGWVLLTIGSTVTFLPLFGNLKFHPEIPWAFPMTLIILTLYWAYFSGWGKRRVRTRGLVNRLPHVAMLGGAPPRSGARSALD